MNLIPNASEAIGDTSGSIIITTGVRNATRSACSGADRGRAAAGRFVYLEVSIRGAGHGTSRRSSGSSTPSSLTRPRAAGSECRDPGIVRGHGAPIFVETARAGEPPIPSSFPRSRTAARRAV